MNEYLKTISEINSSSTSVIPSSSFEGIAVIPELPSDPPEITISSIATKSDRLIQDSIQQYLSSREEPIVNDAEYLAPQKIKLRKYTLKKG